MDDDVEQLPEAQLALAKHGEEIRVPLGDKLYYFAVGDAVRIRRRRSEGGDTFGIVKGVHGDQVDVISKAGVATYSDQDLTTANFHGSKVREMRERYGVVPEQNPPGDWLREGDRVQLPDGEWVMHDPIDGRVQVKMDAGRIRWADASRHENKTRNPTAYDVAPAYGRKLGIAIGDHGNEKGRPPPPRDSGRVIGPRDLTGDRAGNLHSVVQEAKAAGRAAAHAADPTQFPFGYVWLDLYGDGSRELAKALWGRARKDGGVYKDMISWPGLSFRQNEAGAQAMADVFTRYGFEASARGNLD
jgi:hypothetical protein